MPNVIVDGILRTTAPLHISSPQSGLRYAPSTRHFTFGKSGYPCTPTRTMDVLVEASDNGRPVESVPVIPASSLRGRLRRLASREIESALGDEKLTWQAYQMLHCGAFAARPVEAKSLSDIRTLREDPMLGLFGGGPHLLPGKLQVATGIPMINAVANLLPADATPVDVQSYQLLCAIPVLRKDDILNPKADSDPTSVMSNAEAYYEEQLSNSASRKAKELKAKLATDEAVEIEEAVEPERGLRAMAYVQAVVAQTPFYVRFCVRNGTDEQIGLFLTALNRFVTSDEGIGGKSAVGFGSFQHELFIATDGGAREPLFTSQDGAYNTDVVRPYIDAVDAVFATAGLAKRYIGLTGVA